MDKKSRVKELAKKMNPQLNKKAEEKKFVSAVKSVLGKKKYRADLQIATKSRDTSKTFSAQVKYNKDLGYPSENDLLSLVAQTYDNHEINWELVEVDPEFGIVDMVLEPSVEVVPIDSIKSIPPEFKPIGTGVYKRAADATGNVNEIWTLRKTDDGLALFRSNDDLEVTADIEEEEFKAGDVVMTPYGPGKIQRMDDAGNAFVQVGNRRRLVAASDLAPYSIDKEKAKLLDYYTQAYGEKSFAEQLLKDFVTNKK